MLTHSRKLNYFMWLLALFNAGQLIRPVLGGLIINALIDFFGGKGGSSGGGGASTIHCTAAAIVLSIPRPFVDKTY